MISAGFANKLRQIALPDIAGKFEAVVSSKEPRDVPKRVLAEVATIGFRLRLAFVFGCLITAALSKTAL